MNISMLFKAVTAILILAIMGVAVMVVNTMTTKHTVPRTAAERDIMDSLDAVKANPQSVDALLSLAAAYAGSGKYADAVPVLNRVLKLDAKNVKAHYMLGVVAREQGKLDDAVSYLKKASGLKGEDGPVYNDIYFELGKTYHQQGRKSQALEALETAKSFGLPLYLYTEIAKIAEEIGDKEQAKMNYLSVLMRDINNEEALASLKRLGVDQKTISKTIEDGRGSKVEH